MKDIYNEPDIGGGSINKTFIHLDKKKIKNPMVEFLQSTNSSRQYGSYLFKHIKSQNNKTVDDIYLMPINSKDDWGLGTVKDHQLAGIPLTKKDY